MIYILMILFINLGSGHTATSFSAEFNSLKACQDAGKAMNSAVGDGKVVMICISKGK